MGSPLNPLAIFSEGDAAGTARTGAARLLEGARGSRMLSPGAVELLEQHEEVLQVPFEAIEAPDLSGPS